jgi:hypothetical protein
MSKKPMFDAWKKASHANRYQLAWIELPSGSFKMAIEKWLEQLKKMWIQGGPSTSDRKALGDEFNHLMHVYLAVIMRLESMPPNQLGENITTFNQLYKKKFKKSAAVPDLLGDRQVVDMLAVNAAKHDKLKTKQDLVRWWIHGVEHGNAHIDGESELLMDFQYMGNLPKEKVRLFLQVMLDEAARGTDVDSAMHPWLKKEGSLEIGGKASREITYTEDQFKSVIAGSASASYGVSAHGECSIEFKNIKAELKADAFAGVKGQAEFEAAYQKGVGVSMTGTVEAMVGIKLSCEAKVDVADIFLIQASAEAFAGAMAKGEIEFTADVNGVAFKIGVEAFAGAKLKGKAAMTFKMCGYEIVKGEAEGYVSAGIGAQANFEFSASTFGGAKLGFGAGYTMGVGAGGDAKVTVYGDNFSRVAHSLYYVGYLEIMGEGQKAYTWKTYFRELEDNKILFERADEKLAEMLATVELERALMGSKLGAWKEMDQLARFSRPQLFPA